jgi:hypothetical protein
MYDVRLAANIDVTSSGVSAVTDYTSRLSSISSAASSIDVVVVLLV